jgi:hypothetical protein
MPPRKKSTNQPNQTIDKRDPPRSIRVSHDEWAEWEAAAAADGDMGISAWLRRLAARELKRIKRANK